MAQAGVRGESSPDFAEKAIAVSIPDKLYFRIGEVANLCGLPAYVLRFWESEFPQLKPNKGGTGQRLYRQRDVRMVLRIKRLLYGGGYTIPGARQVLASEQRAPVPQLTLAIVEQENTRGTDRKALLQLREAMVQLRAILNVPGAGPAAAPDVPAASTKAVHPMRSRPMTTAATPDLFD